MSEGNRELNRRIMAAFKAAEEARIRLLGALAILVEDEIISSGRARELGSMSIDEQRDYLRGCLTAEDGGAYLHSRCPECGHRLREDLPASGCPQCGTTFGPFVPSEYPEICQCDRCVAVRDGVIEWNDPFAAGKGEG